MAPGSGRKARRFRNGDVFGAAASGKVLSLSGLLKGPTDQAHGGVVCIAAGSFHVSIAVQAAAEASYVYTTTKSKAEARALTRCVVV